MKEIRSIIVPIDFLQHNEQLVEYAMYIGRKFDARLTFIHVLALPYEWCDSDSQALALFAKEAARHVSKKMKQLIKKLQKRFTACEGKVLRGNITDAIVRYVEWKGADLIIMGTHGRKKTQQFYIGSIAERVIRLAPCPTLTCNPCRLQAGELVPPNRQEQQNGNQAYCLLNKRNTEEDS